MNKHTKLAIFILILGVLGVLGYKFAQPFIAKQFTSQTSDAKNTKGKITIALDSWIGYFPLQSPVFKKLMRDEGYIIVINDDAADYSSRMQKLANREIEFAVATVDSYILNGQEEDFPATIVSVIDESKGGDALVGWEDKFKSLDDLKNVESYKIAYTPASPSEHLIKAIGVHFGVEKLLDRAFHWQEKTNGAEEAYKKFMKKETDAAALWEPFVTQALSNKGVVKLLSTEDTEKLIVDILLVNRIYSDKNPEVVSLFLENYFKALKVYEDDPELLKKDIVKTIKEAKSNNVDSILNGVQWVNLYDNARWYGLVSSGSITRDELASTIDSTINVLLENGDFDYNPLPNEDAYTLINSSFIEQLAEKNLSGMLDSSSSSSSGDGQFKALSDSQWKKLKDVGTLKDRAINFMSGTSQLDTTAEYTLEEIANDIGHYPKFRILVKGHTGTRGDADMNRQLSQERADAVREYLISNFGIEDNRIKAFGMGGDEPLKRGKDESARTYSQRLKRVEIRLVTSTM